MSRPVVSIQCECGNRDPHRFVLFVEGPYCNLPGDKHRKRVTVQPAYRSLASIGCIDCVAAGRWPGNLTMYHHGEPKMRPSE